MKWCLVQQAQQVPQGVWPWVASIYVLVFALKEELDGAVASFEVTDKQADIIKKAIKYSIEKGVLFPSKYVASVLDTFGMVE